MFSRAVGREGCCKLILLACARSISSTLGLPLLARTPLRLYVAPLGNRLKPALGFMHLPSLSRSGSVLKKPSEVQVWLGLCFVPFPGPSSSGVWRARSLQLMAFPSAQFSGCTTGVPSQVDYDCPEPPEVLVSKEACLHFGR